MVAVLCLKLCVLHYKMLNINAASLMMAWGFAVGVAHGCSYLGYRPVPSNMLTKVCKCVLHLKKNTTSN